MASDTFRDLRPLLSPKSIAVLGASERNGSAGRLVLENLQNLGYPGEIFAINPTTSQVMGLTTYPDLRSLPRIPEMVAIVLGADKVLPTLETMVELGIPAAWALASGFSEAGPQGKELQARVSAYAREHGLLLCGPNCVGVANLVDRSATYSVAMHPGLQPGSVSAVMQSGAILMGLANATPFGFRFLISSGNEAVLDSADYIAHLADDPGTRVIVAFLEGIRDAGKFLAAARKVRASGKPLLVLKLGRSEAAQRAVQAHTGSLAGSDAVLDAVFQREGIIRLDNLDELVEAARLFLTCPLPVGDGIGLLSLSGGQIGLLSDLAQNLELNFTSLAPDTIARLKEILPAYTTIANPLDAWGTGDLEKMYPACVAAVANDPEVNLIAMSRDTSPGVAAREIEQSTRVAEAAIRAKNETGKPVVIFSNFSGDLDRGVENLLAENGIPYLRGTPETLHALQALEQFAAFQRRPPRESEIARLAPDHLPFWRERLAAGRPMDEFEGRKLLADYGIPGPREATAPDEDTAIQRAAEIGYPVVLKILSPDIQHKTEAGGVRLGVADEDALRAAYREVIQSARAYKPEARLDGVLIQEMIPGESVEVILGILQDDSFGPVMVLGSGGVLVELVKDSVLRLPPLTRAEARGMVEKIRGSKLLKGFRGRPAADIEALMDALMALSNLATDVGDQVSALEINPLMVLPEGRGVRAVDVLCEIRR